MDEEENAAERCHEAARSLIRALHDLKFPDDEILAVAALILTSFGFNRGMSKKEFYRIPQMIYHHYCEGLKDMEKEKQ